MEPGTTELTEGIDEYRYERFNYHIDRYQLGKITLEAAIKAFQEDCSYYEVQDV